METRAIRKFIPRQLVADYQDITADESHDTTGSTQTLAELGISKDQSSKWQQLAAVPQDEFEAHLAGQEKPSTTGILRQRDERRGMLE